MRKFFRAFALTLCAALTMSFASCSSGSSDSEEKTGPTAVKNYTVTFDSDGGSEVASQIVESGKTATKPTDPTKTGYSFNGWYKGESSFDFATAITADVTLKAKWTEKAIGSISYLTTVVEKITEDSAFTNTLTTTGDGTVTYSSSDETVANVNASTGEVTIVAAGITTITATVADSDSYAYATKTATYTIRVKTPEGFVKVPGKTITGNETWVPESKVFVDGRSLTIADLYVCDHEVTQSEYEKYCSSSGLSDTYGKGDNFPVYNVSWNDAIVYCNLRSMYEGLTPCYTLGEETDPTKWSGIVSETTDGVTKYRGPSFSYTKWDYKGESDEDGGIIMNTAANGYRLPTEAEWEYIAREGKTSGTTYSGSNTIGDVAWYKENSGSKSHEVKTDKVTGTDSANALGIYDMSGNVCELCYDRYSSVNSDTGASGASSASSIAGRVVRGGYWGYYAGNCDVADRSHSSPGNVDKSHGFRVVRNAE